jgi:hypothetical protein
MAASAWVKFKIEAVSVMDITQSLKDTENSLARRLFRRPIVLELFG